MRKTLLFLVLTSLLFTTKAGYLIRGISSLIDLDFKNFTLTFDENGEPVSAGSMIDYFQNYGIVIVEAHNSTTHFFPVLINNENLKIEVRDFHYLAFIDKFILCGSRGEGTNVRAFIAIMEGDFSSMIFYEYQDASVFYSICNDHFNYPSLSRYGYYLCGKKDNYGVVVTLDFYTLQITNRFKTEIDWEYHKIIAIPNSESTMPHFVVSGRNPNCDSIGFTMFDPFFSTISSYMWAQITEPLSHCVVADDILVNDGIILASSDFHTLTLNPITIPISLPTITAYQYGFYVGPRETRYYVQDIGTIRTGIDNLRISVAGYTETGPFPSHYNAWYGDVTGLSTHIPMICNNYYEFSEEQYKNYKKRYNQGETYTGGDYHYSNSMGSLFATPLIPSEECDNHFTSVDPNIEALLWTPFYVSQANKTETYKNEISPNPIEMNIIKECDFSKSYIPPQLAPPHNETEIITFYDHITLKDTPTNTNYQIYNIMGQMIQAGTTNPDISTAQLIKGIYILRLENGKAFKFVKQ